jgi:FkbM family methyltransferase
MDLYGQDAELYLLSRLLAHLNHRTMIDVGAERGSMAEGMLRAGVESLHALDADPDNASALRTRFAGDRRVSVHECAVSDDDGHAELHVSTEPDGSPLPFGHTLLERADTDEIAWKQTVTVTRRSLQSLIAAGEIPCSVGILKIDTEGHDLAVVRGMGTLEADVVMVEHWVDLPHGLGRCPWTTQDMLGELNPRGFNHFGFIVHRGELVTLKWDDGEVEYGAMGNLIFLHDSALPRLLPAVLDCGGRLAEQAVRVGQSYMQAADERLALVHDLERVADKRLTMINELKQAADDRLALINELTEVSETRLRALESAEAQLKDQSTALESLRRRTIDNPAG